MDHQEVMHPMIPTLVVDGVTVLAGALLSPESMDPQTSTNRVVEEI